jgi:hypothetical protein
MASSLIVDSYSPYTIALSKCKWYLMNVYILDTLLGQTGDTHGGGKKKKIFFFFF